MKNNKDLERKRASPDFGDVSLTGCDGWCGESPWEAEDAEIVEELVPLGEVLAQIRLCYPTAEQIERWEREGLPVAEDDPP